MVILNPTESEANRTAEPQLRATALGRQATPFTSGQHLPEAARPGPEQNQIKLLETIYPIYNNFCANHVSRKSRHFFFNERRSLFSLLFIVFLMC